MAEVLRRSRSTRVAPAQRAPRQAIHVASIRYGRITAPARARNRRCVELFFVKMSIFIAFQDFAVSHGRQ
jgi:hypothetical protein